MSLFSPKWNEAWGDKSGGKNTMPSFEQRIDVTIRATSAALVAARVGSEAGSIAVIGLADAKATGLSHVCLLQDTDSPERVCANGTSLRAAMADVDTKWVLREIVSTGIVPRHNNAMKAWPMVTFSSVVMRTRQSARSNDQRGPQLQRP